MATPNSQLPTPNSDTVVQQLPNKKPLSTIDRSGRDRQYLGMIDLVNNFYLNEAVPKKSKVEHTNTL
jgi:hypothetical protein